MLTDIEDSYEIRIIEFERPISGHRCDRSDPGQNFRTSDIWQNKQLEPFSYSSTSDIF